MPSFVNKKVISALKNALALANAPNNPEAVPLAEVIQPTVAVNMPDLTGIMKGIKTTINIGDTSANTFLAVTGGTVPAGKRWYIITAALEDTSGATALVIKNADTTEGYLSERSTTAKFTQVNGEAFADSGAQLGALGTGVAPGDNGKKISFLYIEVDW